MDRLEDIHVTLARAMQAARGDDAFAAPVTVAEIYQDLVPYRAVRTQLGFDMNADYEHTLLRLLAGESDLARLEPPEARKELRSELGAANPNVGLFRKFAACDVWISRPAHDALIVDAPEPARTNGLSREGDAWESRSALWMDPSAIPHTDPEPEDVRELVLEEETEAREEEAFELLLDDAIEIGDPVPEPMAAEEELVLAEPVDAEPLPAPRPPKSEEPVLSTTVSSAGAASAATPGTSSCAFCDSGLPKNRAVKFCPFCGADQSMVPCGSCGEPLEPDWRYCIACGADGPTASARA